MTLDWNSDPLAAGLACYRAEQFFDTHELWESVWLTLQEPEKSFLQSLVQVTAAFHHFERNNIAGTVSLLRRALIRLSQCPALFGGIEVASLRTEIKQWLQVLEAGLTTYPATYPRIRPVNARPE